MHLTREQHLILWRHLARELTRGVPLLEALARLRDVHPGTELATLVAALEGQLATVTLHEALQSQAPAIPRTIREMARAGETGGMLDVVAGQVAAGLEEGSLPLPGEGPATDQASLWRVLARLLAAGVSVLEALELLEEEVVSQELGDLCQSLRRQLLDGSTLGTALATMPQHFPVEVQQAVTRAEQCGELDEAARTIAQALATGSMAALAPAAPGGAAIPPPEDARGELAARLVDELFQQAIARQATDIHLQPTIEGRGRIRIRVDGQLQPLELTTSSSSFSHLVTRIKALASMDVAERQLPQDGRILVTREGRTYDLRVSVVPTVRGEQAVLRVLDAARVVMDLSRLFFQEDDLSRVRELCQRTSGLVICNGPTGSGKSTTLYAMLAEVNQPSRQVLSVESPVEYVLDGVGQIQVAYRRGLGFAPALRAVLRQDPDVIMVGEIQDLEGLQLVAQCALTGHLVLTTLHSGSGAQALRRMLDVGLEHFLVNSALAGVITQRLVRRLCPACRRVEQPEARTLPRQAIAFVEAHPEATFQVPVGCEACRGAGYKGRGAIYEIVVPDASVQEVVAAGGKLADLERAIRATGTRSLLEDGLQKAAQGLTSVLEVCRVVPQPPGG